MNLRYRVVAGLAALAIAPGLVVAGSASAAPSPAPVVGLNGLPEPATNPKVGEVPRPPKVDPNAKPVVVENLNGKRGPNGKLIQGPSPSTGLVYAGQQHFQNNLTAAANNASIAKPSIDSPDDQHSLWEMTLQDNAGNTVEVGWVTNRFDLFGAGCSASCELDPHVFASAWYNNAGTSTWCGSYSGGCGYTDYAGNATNVGADILADKDTGPLFQIVVDAGNIWLYYKNNWLGYFPANLGHGITWTTTTRTSSFGEIGYTHFPTCTDMGNSWLANATNTYPTSGAYSDWHKTAVSGGAYANSDFGSSTVTDNTKWALVDMTAGSGIGKFRYGGPGYSPNPGACPYNP